MYRQVVCLSIVCGLAACAASVEPTEAEEAGAPEGATVFSCPMGACDNSPEVTYKGVWEFSLIGAADSNNIRPFAIAGKTVVFKDDPITRGALIPYTLSVENNHELVGRNGSVVIRGAALIGARLHMYRGTVHLYDIWITDVRKVVKFIVAPYSLIETYTMRWTAPGALHTRISETLCNKILAPTNDNKQWHLNSMNVNENLVFVGDRFHPSSMTVDREANDNWVNFGCAGHTLSKLYVNRATVHTEPSAYFERRQMFLKMFVADYCGSGKAYTLTGAPIAFQGTPSHPAFPGPETGIQITTVDARWTAAGARCVWMPRMKNSPLDTEHEFDNISHELELCGAQTCNDADRLTTNLAGATELLSVNRLLTP